MLTQLTTTWVQFELGQNPALNSYATTGVNIAYLRPGSASKYFLLSTIFSCKAFPMGKPFRQSSIVGTNNFLQGSCPYLLNAARKPRISPGIPTAFPPKTMKIDFYCNAYRSNYHCFSEDNIVRELPT